MRISDWSSDVCSSDLPAALVLFNPVVDNGPEGYGHERIGERYREFSPLHNVGPGAPPAIFFLGTREKFIPVETGKRFKSAVGEGGGRCEVIVNKDKHKDFFN